MRLPPPAAACLFALCLPAALAASEGRAVTDPPATGAPPEAVAAARVALIGHHGEAAAPDIDRGLGQVAPLWRASDGDLAAFAAEQYLADPAEREAALARLESVLEQVDGHLNEVARKLREATDLVLGQLLPVDPVLAGWDPASHVLDDLFDTRIAFAALLNFPLTTLAERQAGGAGWSRRQWAEARLAGRFARRVPASVQQEVARAGAEADLYISSYNIWVHHVLDGRGKRLFPKGKRLISHWNLRDEIKAGYAAKDGLPRQRLLVRVMERIVTQEIPAAVIDDPRLDWDPVSNTVRPAPPETVEEGAPDDPLRAVPDREPDTRYARLLSQFRAARLADPTSPVAPTAIARSFELQREIPEARVVEMLERVLSSPVVRKVAAEIRRRLGRKLEPHDLWYDGFQARARLDAAELDRVCRAKYPTAEAFARDIPRILRQLGFAPDRADFLAARIAVDPSRGAGHAMPALRRGDLPRLRTRVGPDGMDYKGYNIAIHELGHNVEQVFSLYGVDHTLLAGVPGSAFTEALAFVFQARDLEILGLAAPDAEAERLRVLNDFWQTWEIAGVSLVDIRAWHWMYDHPDATPAELREAVLGIARDVWNRHYASVLGAQDSPLLAIYSHMVAYPLYLCDYPLGHLIAFQIEERLRGRPDLGAEFERMAIHGSVTPDLWMVNATGDPVGPDALLRATERAVGGK